MAWPYQHEFERLHSFVDWTNDYVQPAALANAGFIYTNEGDRVRCFFCHILISDWQENDIPMEEHRRHSPECPFVVDSNETTNVPLVGTSFSQPFQSRGEDTCTRATNKVPCKTFNSNINFVSSCVSTTIFSF